MNRVNEIECIRRNISPKVFWTYCKHKLEKIGVDIDMLTEKDIFLGKEDYYFFRVYPNGFHVNNKYIEEVHINAFSIHLFYKDNFFFEIEYDFDCPYGYMCYYEMIPETY